RVCCSFSKAPGTSEDPRHLEGRRNLMHFAVVQFFSLLCSILDSSEYGLRNDLRIFLQKFGIQIKRDELSGDCDLNLDRASPGRDLDFPGLQLGLKGLD